MRCVCTEIPFPAMRWASYSMTVFQDGTIMPSLCCHACTVSKRLSFAKLHRRLRTLRPG